MHLSIFYVAATSPNTHIYTCTHLHIYTSTHLHIYTSTHVHVYLWLVVVSFQNMLKLPVLGDLDGGNDDADGDDEWL